MSVRHLSVKLFSVAVLGLGGLAQAATFTFDDSHTAAHFSVKHLMVSNVKGQITGVEGKINLDDKDVTKSSVEATLKVATINTGNGKRDDHLRNEDFFDVKKFPTMKFVSKKVEKAGDGKLKVTGALTIKDKTKDVVLDVEGPSDAVKDPWGNVHRGFAATTKIKRQDFGITWNKNLDGGGVVVGEEVAISIEGELLEAKK